jgi:hypothetical protein
MYENRWVRDLLFGSFFPSNGLILIMQIICDCVPPAINLRSLECSACFGILINAWMMDQQTARIAVWFLRPFLGTGLWYCSECSCFFLAATHSMTSMIRSQITSVIRVINQLHPLLIGFRRIFFFLVKPCKFRDRRNSW